MNCMDHNEEYRLLYKYQPINEYLTENLKNNQLYFRHPREYNDVYDSLVAAYAEGTREEWIECGIKLSTTMNDLKGVPVKSRDEVTSDVDWMIDTGELKKKENSNVYKKEKLDDSYRPLTCCFCGDKDNMLMWGHYADRHKGVCLIFKAKYQTIPKDNCEGLALTINSEPRQIKQIEYKPKLPNRVNQVEDILTGNAQTFNFFLTKSTCWSYENEYRILLDDPETKNKAQFKKEELVGIIFGLKVNYCNACAIITAIKKAYNGIPIKFYKTQENENEYAVDMIEITDKIDDYIDSLLVLSIN